jgi:hypothetical protein
MVSSATDHTWSAADGMLRGSDRVMDGKPVGLRQKLHHEATKVTKVPLRIQLSIYCENNKKQ